MHIHGTTITEKEEAMNLRRNGRDMGGAREREELKGE